MRVIGVAQLVRQYRQKLVLAAIALPQTSLVNLALADVRPPDGDRRTKR